MILPPELKLDPRDAEALLAALRARRGGYVPEWSPSLRGPDAAIDPIVARYVYTILKRLNQAPAKNLLAFLDMLGIQLITPQAARAPMVFQLSATAPNSRIPAGTRIAAPPPPEQTRQVVFETETGIGLGTARLTEVVSLWPGRDQYVNHSGALAAGQAFKLFDKQLLEDTPHALYLAHDILLALAGTSVLDVKFELLTGSSEELKLSWEYWDGKVWREFKNTRKECDEQEAARLDSTEGLTHSGAFRLETDCAETAKTTVNGIEAFWIRARLDETLPPDPAGAVPEVDNIRISATVTRLADIDDPQVLKLDKAFADQLPVDVTKAFLPFGPQPQPGAAFYFTNEEVFTKPGALATASFVRVNTPQDDASTSGIDHVVAWEYWNGLEWAKSRESSESDVDPDSLDLNTTGVIRDILIPPDMARTEVNGQDGLWMRVRLVSGGFGMKQEIELPTGSLPLKSKVMVVQAPALADFRLGYTWQYGPFFAQHVLTYNDFRYEDHTEDAIWPGRTFKPFQPVGDATPALYLGFDKPPPVDRLGTYFDIVELRGETAGPALVWEYWDGFAWQALAAEDETRALRVPGIVSLIGPGDSQALARFGTPRHWLRARLKEDGPPGEPIVLGIFPNAVWAVQHTTVTDEPLGASTRRANQVLQFRQFPVLPVQRVEVREAAGLRANVEWRILAAELFGGGEAEIRAVEALLAAEGSQRDIEYGDLRLRRDRQKRVTEVWVRWHAQPHLKFSGPRDRHYVVEPARGRLILGDGELGRIPPAGAAILARMYRTGGGLAGNVGARSITQTLGAIGSVEAVFNPRAAEGGADGETLAGLMTRGPRTIRHRGRALLPGDYETMAREASASVAFARAVPGLDAAGHHPAPGWITLLIMPKSGERRPWPSFGLREQVRKFVSARAAADLVAAGHIYVTGPQFVPVDVDATVAPLDPSDAGGVEVRTRAALEQFLHPVLGGPAGGGWELGRDVYLSDIASVLEGVAGVDYVTKVTLRREGVPQGERVKVAGDRIVVAGRIRLKLIAREA